MTQSNKNPYLVKAALILQLPLILALVCLYFGVGFVKNDSFILATMLFAVAAVLALIYYVAMKLIFSRRDGRLVGEGAFLQLLQTQGKEQMAEVVGKTLVYTQASGEGDITQKLSDKTHLLNLLDDLLDGKKIMMDGNKMCQAYLRIQYSYEVDGEKWEGQAQLENPFLFEYLRAGHQVKIKVLPQKLEVNQLDMGQWNEDEIINNSRMPKLKHDVMSRVAFGLNTTLGMAKSI